MNTFRSLSLDSTPILCVLAGGVLVVALLHGVELWAKRRTIARTARAIADEKAARNART